MLANRRFLNPIDPTLSNVRSRGLGVKTGLDKVDEGRRSNKAIPSNSCPNAAEACGGSLVTGAMLLGSMIMRKQGGLIDHMRNRDQKESAVRTRSMHVLDCIRL